MPGPTPDPTIGSPSGSTIIQDVLSTAAAALGGGGAAAQIFATPSAHRNHVLIKNNGSGAMYVGFTSDTSSTKHVYKLAADGSVLLAVSPQVSIYVKPDGTGNNYTAHELRIR